MFVKQIDMKEAFRLADKGIEVKVLVPMEPGDGWTGMTPDTLQNMLADVLFFRNEPALEKPEFEKFEPAFAMESVEGTSEPAQEEETNTPPNDVPETPKKGAKRKPVDTGKMMALRKAGWNMKKIADELGISESCVYNHLKRLEEEEAIKRIAESRGE